MRSLVPAAAQQLPDGPGKEILEKQCNTCHTLEVIVAQRNDAAEWKRLVMNMIDRGAEITEEQVPVVVDYLATNWSKPAPPPAETARGEIGIDRAGRGTLTWERFPERSSKAGAEPGLFCFHGAMPAPVRSQEDTCCRDES